MPHIHNEPGQHDLTVSAFIINADGAILIHKHKKYDLYLQPGGHVELDEDPWTAMMREIREETGYDPSQLALYAPPMAVINDYEVNPSVFHPYPISFNTHSIGLGDHRHTDIAYAFYAGDEKPRYEIDPSESQEAFWFKWYADGRPMYGNSPYHIPQNVCKIMEFILMYVTPHWRKFILPQTPMSIMADDEISEGALEILEAIIETKERYEEAYKNPSKDEDGVTIIRDARILDVSIVEEGPHPSWSIMVSPNTPQHQVVVDERLRYLEFNALTDMETTADDLKYWRQANDDFLKKVFDQIKVVQAASLQALGTFKKADYSELNQTVQRLKSNFRDILESFDEFTRPLERWEETFRWYDGDLLDLDELGSSGDCKDTDEHS